MHRHSPAWVITHGSHKHWKVGGLGSGLEHRFTTLYYAYISPVFPLFKCMHRLTSIKNLHKHTQLRRYYKVIGEIRSRQGVLFGVVDDAALFLSLKTSPLVWRLKVWVWFLALNIYNQGNLRSRTLTCSSLIPLSKDTRQSIPAHNFLHTGCLAKLLKQALKSDTKMIHHKYSK